jgi:uncharacterized membrane protein
MAQPPKHQHRKRPWLVRFLRGHWRLWSCSMVGLVVFALLPAEGLPVPRFFFAWDASMILYIGLIYWMIYHSAADHIRQRSADQDEGQELALGLSISAVIVSLSLVVVWLSATPKGSHADLGLGLAALTSRCHGSSFKRSSRCIARTNIIQSAADVEAGCIFPGDGNPNYWDFVYFAFGIGMAAQVADVAVIGKRLRRIVTIRSIST